MTRYTREPIETLLARVSARRFAAPPHAEETIGAVPEQVPRMSFEVIVDVGPYDATASPAVLEPHDEALATHGRSAGRETTHDPWTREAAAKYAAGPRDALGRMSFDSR